jgi:hypothetical protein
VSRNSPEAIAERLLDLSIEIAPAAGLISDLKEQLRKVVEDSGDSLLIEVAGKGSVQVSAGSEEKFKGIVPTLDPVAFLELPQARQDKLVGDGIVTMVKEYSPARLAADGFDHGGHQPSISVKL